MGYQKDTPAAVVFQVSHLLKDHTEEDDVEHWKAKVIIIMKFISMAILGIIRSILDF